MKNKDSQNYLNIVLKKYCANDKEIILNFFEYAESYGDYSKSKTILTSQAIDRILQGLEISSLSFDFLITNIRLWTGNNHLKQALQFLCYLCLNNKLPYCPFYRLLPFSRYIFSNGIIFTQELTNYILLDEKYYQLFISSSIIHWNIKNQKRLVFMYLDESLFPNKEMYDFINDKFQKLKYYPKAIKPINQINNLIYFKSTCYEILKYEPEQIDKLIISDILNLFRENSYLIYVLKLFVDCKYITDDFIVQVITVAYDKKLKNRTFIEEILKSANIQMWTTNKRNQLAYIYCSDPKKLELLKEFYKKTSYLGLEIRLFMTNFDTSLSNPKAPLSFYTYLEQIQYFKKKNLNIKHRKCIMAIIDSFYTFYQVYENNVFEKDGYTTMLLHESGIAYAISEGYEVVNYNKINSIPTSDRWLFCYKQSKNMTTIRISKINFEKIENTCFREWYKKYLWYSDTSTSIAVHDLNKVGSILNYIYQLKRGIVLSIYTLPNNRFNYITTTEVRAWKKHVIGTHRNNRTQLSYIYRFRAFVLFMQENGINSFEEGVLSELTHNLKRDYDNSHPIPPDELDILFIKLGKLANISPIYHLYYVIFYIAVETEFRSSQILRLQVDCVRETAKRNEYVLHSDTKTSNEERIDQPITIYVKRCIDEVLRITSKYRIANSNKSISNFLFIIPGKKNNTYSPINPIKINNFLKETCKEIGIKPYTMANLRDTHMTLTENYIIKEKLSDVQLSVLTGHKSKVTTIFNYSRPSIKNMLEATNGIIIGEIDIKGTILKDLDSKLEKKENLVSEGCGYCSSSECSCFTDLDCLLCTFFVTTIDRKPYFEERKVLLDKLIQESVLEHDKNDLVARKKLILAYIDKIISLELEVKNANS